MMLRNFSLVLLRILHESWMVKNESHFYPKKWKELSKLEQNFNLPCAYDENKRQLTLPLNDKVLLNVRLN